MGQNHDNYEYREPPGATWGASRMWVVSEINRNAKDIGEVEKTTHTNQVDIAVIQAKAALLGAIGGIISAGVVTLIVKLLVH